MSCDAVIFDVDGTLVDSNYHHALAWYRAFRRLDKVLPIWQIHRHIGIGGDRMVAALAGDSFDERHGEEARQGHREEFDRLLDEISALDGAHELLAAMAERGIDLVIASSGQQYLVDRFLDLVQAKDLVHAVVSQDEVQESKPAPDLVERARETVGGRRALMVGDAVWDARAAASASVPFVALRTGGFSERELTDAGAMAVFHSPRDLLDHIDDWIGGSAEE